MVEEIRNGYKPLGYSPVARILCGACPCIAESNNMGRQLLQPAADTLFSDMAQADDL